MKITQAQTKADIQGIWSLQKLNLPKNISQAEADEQGFVTVDHQLSMLEQMNQPFGHIIAKEQDQVVGYCLMMERKLKDQIPELRTMFRQIDQIQVGQKLLSSFEYMVMGQVCVAKDYRAKGVFAKMYHKMRDVLKGQYQYIITEIDLKNKRSIRAHEKVGFELLHEFKDGPTDWLIVGWKL